MAQAKAGVVAVLALVMTAQAPQHPRHSTILTGGPIAVSAATPLLFRRCGGRVKAVLGPAEAPWRE